MKSYIEKQIEEYSKDPQFVAETLSTSFIEQVLSILEERGLTQEDLAKKAELTPRQAAFIFSAPENLSLFKMVQLAIALGMEIDITLKTKENSNV